MKQWACVGLTILVASSVACKKNSACPEAQKSARAKVIEAGTQAESEARDLAANLEKAKHRASAMADAQRNFNEEIKLLEQSMDCLVHSQDCCARAGKIDLHDRLFNVKALDVARYDHANDVPRELAPVLKHFGELAHKDSQGPNSTDAKTVENWCVLLRAEIGHIRDEAPPVWEAAIAEAKREADEADQAAMIQKRKQQALHDWSVALRTAKPVEISQTLGSGSPPFETAREAVQSVQSACR